MKKEMPSKDTEKKMPPMTSKGKETSAKGSQPEEKDGEKHPKDKVEFNPTMKEAIEREFAEICEGIDPTVITEEDLNQYIAERVQIAEVLTLQGRMKKRAVMKRYKAKLHQKHQRALQKYAAKDVINRRARHKAVDTLKARFTQGRAPADLSVSEKQRVERMVQARKKLVTRLASRLVRDVKATERARMQGK